jgi:SulP family sulfate permease
MGAAVTFIPRPVVVGFTNGIAVLIASTQIRDFFGLQLDAVPGAFWPRMVALSEHARTFSPPATALAIGAVVCILVWNRFVRAIPGYIVVLLAGTVAVLALKLPVETIGSRFGGIPHGLPVPHLPAITAPKLVAILPTALSFTLLGGIESLLSAVVADGMTGRRHRSNMELTAQGLANMASAMFGGIAVTGTIARTATNVRAGARSPVAGMLHAAFLLAFMLLAAPLASYVPVSALAGVLVVVAWNMAEKAEIARLLRNPQTGLVLAATFVLTVLRDLTSGILAGCLLAALLWLGPRLIQHIRTFFKPA